MAKKPFMKRLSAQQEKRKADTVVSDIEQVITNKQPDFKQHDSNAHHIMAEISRPDVEPEGQIIRVDIDLVYATEQVRPEEDFDNDVINGMSDTYNSIGMLVPPRCFPRDRKGFRIWMGETRVRAARKRGDKQIDIYVGKPPKDEKDRIIGQLIENLQQSGLKPLATAKGFKELKELYGMSGEQIARTMGKPTSFVSKHLRLLDAPVAVTSLIRDGITTDVDLAYTLLQVSEKSPEEADKLITEARGAGISRAQVKDVLNQLKTPQTGNISHAKSGRKSGPTKPVNKSAQLWNVWVEFSGQEGIVITTRSPEKDGSIWVKTESGETCVAPSLLSVKGLKPV